jgi:hypothetical protein
MQASNMHYAIQIFQETRCQIESLGVTHSNSRKSKEIVYSKDLSICS